MRRSFSSSNSARTSRPDLPAHIRRFDITADGTPVDRGVVVEATVGLFDGIRLDDEDRIWAGAGDGVIATTMMATWLARSSREFR